jgi:hypothetical protein
VGDTSTGTGRLFRSLRAAGASADSALPALTLDEAVGLRTVTLNVSPTAPAPTPPAPTPPTPTPPAPTAPVLAAATPAVEYAEVAPRPEEEPSPLDPPAQTAPAAAGVPARGVWLVVIGITVLMGFADALVVGRTQLGWLTGVALLAASVYGALVIRRSDDIVAVIAPPLAFFAATITAGQLTLPPSGGLLVREAFMIITTLGANALWIFGATLAALAIVLWRRRRQVS